MVPRIPPVSTPRFRPTLPGATETHAGSPDHSLPLLRTLPCVAHEGAAVLPVTTQYLWRGVRSFWPQTRIVAWSTNAVARRVCCAALSTGRFRGRCWCRSLLCKYVTARSKKKSLDILVVTSMIDSALDATLLLSLPAACKRTRTSSATQLFGPDVCLTSGSFHEATRFPSFASSLSPAAIDRGQHENHR